MRRLGFLLTGLAILVGINVTVWRFEHAMSSGETVLLELAPVDPRSLMQGDYMRLSYALARQLGSPRQEGAATQTLVIRLDEQQVAQRVEGGTPDALAPDQRLLQVRRQHNQWWIGPDAFFFEEGTAVQYEQARYGEFRLQPDGATLLVGLRDQALKPIGHTRPAW
ncbi:GDYXXLXY domain-containing protein [Aeromonas rivipollensis]|uniref:GDYXXLXY domain-containing protein n=1 Tax=Aeromonas rivipollensis TaxID=948519 RepID=A0ABX0D4M2_9GAMM|nr:GDYXXLXY domain-containing protein [Aeromonas rivipollensis]NEX89775.1 GDYXXLXY domain-containing protein [Aeromonas rivipollensis]NEY08130.1 GDYXXLXY domain-containing protein [Aeromonas rivipollensis]